MVLPDAPAALANAESGETNWKSVRFSSTVTIGVYGPPKNPRFESKLYENCSAPIVVPTGSNGLTWPQISDAVVFPALPAQEIVATEAQTPGAVLQDVPNLGASADVPRS